MCGFCGCENTDEHIHTHEHDHEHVQGHIHDQQHSHMISLEQDILAENNRFAAQNRQFLNHLDITALNLVSSPGSGKTTLLEKTINHLKQKKMISVIEGDQQTDHDAIRIAKTGIPVLQINTGKACHLDAHDIAHALPKLSPKKNSLLFIENVGNLICPALFDLGEKHKVVILSVTEGEDKPLKYPNMFENAELMLINKIDLLPYVDFDINQCIEYAKRINSKIKAMEISAKTEAGFSPWLQWCQDIQT